MTTGESVAHEPRLPAPARWFNRVGDAAMRMGLRPVRLHVDELLATAQKRTGLSDFGFEATTREGLDRFVDSLESEGELSLIGRFSIRYELLRMLTNRLQVEEAIAREPAILDQPLRRPIIIVGLPRTGTTLLHNLLSVDPRTRAPKFWELRAPAPPPVPDSPATDPRIRDAEFTVRLLDWLVPDFKARHELSPHSPEECTHLLMQAFMSASYDAQANVRSYMDWLLEADQDAGYRYVERCLKVLQWNAPGMFWVLKSPMHLFGFDALLKVFPNALIVQTHRHPQKVAASCCSLYEAASRPFTDRRRPLELGDAWMRTWSVALERSLEARDAAGQVHFHDVWFDDVMADHVGTVRSIYERFGLRWEQSMADRIQEWIDSNPRHKHGVHRYSLDRYGITESSVDLYFRRYLERFFAEDLDHGLSSAPRSAFAAGK